MKNSSRNKEACWTRSFCHASSRGILLSCADPLLYGNRKIFPKFQNLQIPPDPLISFFTSTTTIASRIPLRVSYHICTYVDRYNIGAISALVQLVHFPMICISICQTMTLNRSSSISHFFLWSEFQSLCLMCRLPLDGLEQWGPSARTAIVLRGPSRVVSPTSQELSALAGPTPWCGQAWISQGTMCMSGIHQKASLMALWMANTTWMNNRLTAQGSGIDATVQLTSFYGLWFGMGLARILDDS